ncbi:MAG: hypothetical protein IJ766_01405 [Clostridia bacterium]|nr:hypothetical protein [Clostridia bacterium]
MKKRTVRRVILAVVSVALLAALAVVGIYTLMIYGTISGLGKYFGEYNRITVTYADGSFIRNKGGERYEHVLSGGNTLFFLSEHECTLKLGRTSQETAGKRYDVESYAFNPSGYVTVHSLGYRQGDSDTLIAEDMYYLFNFSGDTAEKFSSAAALTAYCGERHIYFSATYTYQPGGSVVDTGETGL